MPVAAGRARPKHVEQRAMDARASDVEQGAAAAPPAAHEPPPNPAAIVSQYIGQSAALGEGAAFDESGDQLRCYVCLEDEAEAPLAHACGCTNSVIHRSCLEKLVNSRKSREKPLEERTRCSVCTQQFCLDFVPFVIERRVPCWVKFQASALGSILTPLCSVILALLLVGVLMRLLGRSFALILLVGMGVVLWPICAARNIAERRRHAALNVDDNTFFEKTVAQARREVRRRRVNTTLQEAAELPSSRVVLVVSGSAPAQHEGAPDAPPAGDPPSAAADAAAAEPAHIEAGREASAIPIRPAPPAALSSVVVVSSDVPVAAPAAP